MQSLLSVARARRAILFLTGLGVVLTATPLSGSSGYADTQPVRQLTPVTLAQAEATWPDAQVVLDGVMNADGDFIVPWNTAGYVLVKARSGISGPEQQYAPEPASAPAAPPPNPCGMQSNPCGSIQAPPSTQVCPYLPTVYETLGYPQCTPDAQGIYLGTLGHLSPTDPGAPNPLSLTTSGNLDQGPLGFGLMGLTPSVSTIANNPTGALLGGVQAAGSSNVGCRGYWLEWDIYDPLGSYSGAAHLNTGWCGNGTRVWQNWGPDCPFSAGAVYGGNDSGGWCGVVRNNTPDPESGSNWWVSPYTTPFYKRWGYQRMHVYTSGSYNWYGACCN